MAAHLAELALQQLSVGATDHTVRQGAAAAGAGGSPPSRVRSRGACNRNLDRVTFARAVVTLWARMAVVNAGGSELRVSARGTPRLLGKVVNATNAEVA